jgi:hypothetical protein
MSRALTWCWRHERKPGNKFSSFLYAITQIVKASIFFIVTLYYNIITLGTIVVYAVRRWPKRYAAHTSTFIIRKKIIVNKCNASEQMWHQLRAISECYTTHSLLVQAVHLYEWILLCITEHKPSPSSGHITGQGAPVDILNKLSRTDEK